MIWILVMKIAIPFDGSFSFCFRSTKKKRNNFFYTRIYTFVLEGNKLTNKRLLTMISESLISRMWG